ncbi:ATP phosphoribosyltransferase [Actinobacteria bacterium YIM 96077]|uniref:ATP phosphoribosyltransferase n=1 Tax=Phytoactinopolyspora halophila TaxID=1981511 RepID=A0A329QNE0_9ACTN|nr:ATP phosphoribosyltransferase [Phytoactinopolyspora halophila]AYY12975.1 ATP phosphoribosyltransferase [Actinobacteria bacterium YIM 96077]RAW13239.1 ATP phosphoribosyltransferase [Phytoactinopolyspora halophila]
MTVLRIAVPNKGSLAEPSAEMLREAGYRQRGDDGRELVLSDPENGVEFFFLRPRDIAVYVGSGTLDVGITGRDLLLDSGADAEELLSLGFARSTFRFAARPDTATDLSGFDGLRVATSYAGLLRTYLSERDVDAEVIKLDGAVETAVQLGVADIVADVVETGTTLRQAGLEIVGEPILNSEAVLIGRAGAEPAPGTEQLKRRIEGVLVARRYVMMDYDIRAERVEEASALTPGLESPTVSPLHREGWVAVRAMVPRDRAQRVMDELWQIGARAILVTEIVACRV